MTHQRTSRCGCSRCTRSAAEEREPDLSPEEVAAQLAGTTQNDIIKEYLSRGTYVFPPDALAAA